MSDAKPSPLHSHAHGRLHAPWVSAALATAVSHAQAHVSDCGSIATLPGASTTPTVRDAESRASPSFLAASWLSADAAACVLLAPASAEVQFVAALVAAPPADGAVRCTEARGTQCRLRARLTPFVVLLPLLCRDLPANGGASSSKHSSTEVGQENRTGDMASCMAFSRPGFSPAAMCLLEFVPCELAVVVAEAC